MRCRQRRYATPCVFSDVRFLTVKNAQPVHIPMEAARTTPEVTPSSGDLLSTPFEPTASSPHVAGADVAPTFPDATVWYVTLTLWLRRSC